MFHFTTFLAVVTSLSESQEFEEVHVAQHVCAMGAPPGHPKDLKTTLELLEVGKTAQVAN